MFSALNISEMVSAMKGVASMDVELTVEERNLLSVAYKNVIGARRASWRIISSIEQKEESKPSEDKLKMIKAYREQVRAFFGRSQVPPMRSGTRSTTTSGRCLMMTSRGNCVRRSSRN